MGNCENQIDCGARLSGKPPTFQSINILFERIVDLWSYMKSSVSHGKPCTKHWRIAVHMDDVTYSSFNRLS